MTNRQTYERILAEDRIAERLFPIMEEAGVLAQLGIISISKEELDGFPFIASVERYDHKMPIPYMARYIGCPLDLSPISPGTGPFYFPFVSIPGKHPLVADDLMGKKRKPLIAHEVRHVVDILDYTWSHPEYYEDLATLSLGIVSGAENLERSMRFEIDKILRLEPNALKAEYRAGAKTILVPLFFGSSEYECATCEEFVWIQLCDDLRQIHNAYLAKFPASKDEVKKTFERLAVEMCGKAVGPDTYARIMGITKIVFGSLLSRRRAQRSRSA